MSNLVPRALWIWNEVESMSTMFTQYRHELKTAVENNYKNAERAAVHTVPGSKLAAEQGG